MLTEKTVKNCKKYSCEICDFHTSDKQNYTRHCSTRKHLELTNQSKQLTIKTDDVNTYHICSHCDKKYTSRVGLWKHKQKCKAPDKENISQAIAENKLEDRVSLLGYVTDQDKNILLNATDLFVQPNIKVAGDMEGFGISVIEAGACRLPVLASDMEGLKDAIKDEKNGFLVQPENADAFAGKITELFAAGSPREIYGENVRNFVIENYSWKNIAQIYLSEIQKIINK